jgi:hypothetical protein
MSHTTINQFATRRDFEQAQAAQSGKKLVVYEKRPGIDFIAVGGSAYIVPVDHPDTVRVTNGHVAQTTYVEWYNDETGVFETKNTRYVPNTLVA